MIRHVAAVFFLAQLASSAPSPYLYNVFSTVSSTPTYVSKQSLNLESPTKFGVGYKVQDGGGGDSSSTSTKGKKEYDNSAHQNLFSSNTAVDKHPLSNFNLDFTSFDDAKFSTASSSVTPSYGYPSESLNEVSSNEFLPQSISNKAYHLPYGADKIFIHHDHHDDHGHHHGHHHDHHHTGKHHFVHNVLDHYITDVAGHKIKHVGEALESGALTEPIIHKLSFAKAALLHILAILGPLSAIKGLHIAAKASDHKHAEKEHHDAPLPAISGEHVEPLHHHHTTLKGIIYNFVAQLSNFNTEAKLHLIPNLLKVISYASGSSSHVSAGHHGHR